MGSWHTRADALKLRVDHSIVGSIYDAALMAPIRTITGVILVDASHRNGPGKGAIRSERDGRTLSWRAPGSAKFGTGVTVTADSDVLLEDGEDSGKYVRARVKFAYLPSGAVEHAVYLQPLWNLILADIGAAEAAAGVVVDRTDFILENTSERAIKKVKGWIEPGTDYLQISNDGAAFSAPTSEVTGVVFGNLAPAGTTPIYTRITIPAATAYNPKVLALLHFSFDGF